MIRPSGTERLGRLLFRHRGVIGLVAFLAVFWLGRPTVASCLLGVPLLAAGLALRYWAMGFIGGDARAGEVGAEVYVGSGPFRWFRLGRKAPAGHPLYAGNLLLVLGMLVCLRPSVPLALLVVVLYAFEYVTIARAEERFLGSRFRGVARHDVRFRHGRARPEWRTGVTVALAFGLALAKALLAGS